MMITRNEVNAHRKTDPESAVLPSRVSHTGRRKPRRIRKLYHPELEVNFTALSVALQNHNGKKVYGYLPKKTKQYVDNIVRLVAAEPEIEELYDLWYQYQCEVYRTYTDAMPEKLPLWENEVFKSIRNMVVDAATQPMSSQVLDSANHYGNYCAAQVIRVIGDIAQMLADEVPYPEQQSQDDVVDSRLRREIEAKRRGELGMSM